MQYKLNECIASLSKMPSSMHVIPLDFDCFDAASTMLSKSIVDDLYKFIENMPGNVIPPESIVTVVVDDFEDKVNKIEETYQARIKELEKTLQDQKQEGQGIVLLKLCFKERYFRKIEQKRFIKFIFYLINQSLALLNQLNSYILNEIDDRRLSFQFSILSSAVDLLGLLLGFR